MRWIQGTVQIDTHIWAHYHRISDQRQRESKSHHHPFDCVQKYTHLSLASARYHHLVGVYVLDGSCGDLSRAAIDQQDASGGSWSCSHINNVFACIIQTRSEKPPPSQIKQNLPSKNPHKLKIMTTNFAKQGLCTKYYHSVSQCRASSTSRLTHPDLACCAFCPHPKTSCEAYIMCRKPSWLRYSAYTSAIVRLNETIDRLLTSRKIDLLGPKRMRCLIIEQNWDMVSSCGARNLRLSNWGRSISLWYRSMMICGFIEFIGKHLSLSLSMAAHFIDLPVFWLENAFEWRPLHLW